MIAQWGDEAGVQDEEVSSQALAQQEIKDKPGGNYPLCKLCQAMKSSRSQDTEHITPPRHKRQWIPGMAGLPAEA